MSKDKNKSHDRQLALLREILKDQKERLEYYSKAPPRLWLNCEGGVSADNKDVVAAIESGYLKKGRTNGSAVRGTPRRFTYVDVTEKGMKALVKG